MKKMFFIPIFSLMIVLLATINSDAANNHLLHHALLHKSSAALADSIAPDTTGMRNLTSVEFSKKMIPGWNLGNSLEAIGGETAWGNPLVSQKLIDSVKAAGFNSVRIPVAWSNNMDMATFTIDQELLNRVEDVVNYVLTNDMYAIINIHWDGGWMQPTYAQQEYVNNRLEIIWRQIAIHFRDYDDHLLFAGTNEVMVDGDYGTPKKEYYTVQNSFNQVFVNTVRSTGGCNYYRHLVVQGFNTNINNTISFFTIPQDVISNRLMVEVHYYDPYNFTINFNTNITQWGKNATDPSKTETWANEAWADGQFNKMKTKFVDKGYAVILGEYGAMARTMLGSDELNAEHAEYRRYYIEYITRSICQHGLVPYYWDNGATGNNSLGLFNRATGAQVYPAIVQSIIDAAREGTGIDRRQQNTVPAKTFLLRNYPNPFNPATSITFTLPARARVALKIYDLLGKEVATLLDKELPAGNHTQTWNASDAPTGEYICRLQVNSVIDTCKLVLVR